MLIMLLAAFTWPEKESINDLHGSLKALRWIHGTRVYQGLLNTGMIQPSELKIAVSMTRA